MLTEQLRTIDKRRLQELVGEISSDAMEQVDNAIMVSLGISL